MKSTLFINHTNGIFGAESVLIQIIDTCVEDKSKVYFIEPNYKGESLFRKKINECGYNNIKSLPYKNLGDSFFRSFFVLFYNIYALIYLLVYIKKNHIEYIYSNTSTTCLGVFVAFFARKKHIWHIHEPTDPNHGWVASLVPLYKLFFRYKKNTIIFVSELQRREWLKYIPSVLSNSRVIYNPIKEFVITAKKEKTDLVTFGYLGTRDKRKNISLLLSSFKKLVDKHKCVRLILSKNIGDYYEHNLKQMKDLGLVNNITEYIVDDASDFYNSIDILVLPSLSETWGMVALEAISMKKPTIITHNSGLTEFLVDGVHTLFINPYDEQSLFNAMEKMLDKTFRDKIALQGYNLIKEYGFNKNFRENILQLFL